jgi:CheY-like chemotaxis protein/DNA-binding XRE family transcriptional regulator
MLEESFDLRKQFGTSVRAWRSRLGVSQEELAGRAGLHRTYVCDVERGARNVTLQSIEKLAGALEISASTLLLYCRNPNAGQGRASPFGADDLLDILYVEDSAADVKLAVDGLKHVTNRIHIVRDGLAAVNFLFGIGEYARRNPQQLPSLILLDLRLPKMDGLDVLRRIKSDPRTAGIAVIVLTASNRERDWQLCQQLGAAAYIVKPIGFQNFSQITAQLNLNWALLKGIPRRPLVCPDTPGSPRVSAQ